MLAPEDEKGIIMATNGSFYWNELMTRDAEAAKKFYGATLGWTFEPMEQGEGASYWVAKVGDESVAGIYQMGADDDENDQGWFAYVAVTDLSTALARATSEGGGRKNVGTLNARTPTSQNTNSAIVAIQGARRMASEGFIAAPGRCARATHARSRRTAA